MTRQRRSPFWRRLRTSSLLNLGVVDTIGYELTTIGPKGKQRSMKLSLRVRLSLFWLVIVVICTALGVIMHRVYSLGVDAQTARMRDTVREACETIQRQYTLSIRRQGVQGSLDSELAYAVLEAVLRDTPEVEGGIWRDHDTLEAQFVADA